MPSRFSKQSARLRSQDQMELLSVQNLQQGFPEHYHDTFCISLIRQGTEAIQFREHSWYAPAGHFSITNPQEIHANPLLPAKNLTFDTLYISQDMVDHFMGRKDVSFQHVAYSNAKAVAAFDQLARSFFHPAAPAQIEGALQFLLRTLSPIAQARSSDLIESFPSLKWEQLIAFIEAQIKEKIDLALLARLMHMDKYQFAKAFRKRFGLSPINFVLMKKVFCAKADITAGTDLTSIAYTYNFSDLAHFSRTFKRFIGVPPNTYKSGLRA
ncbi:MAG: AraC family transcriptional regulator [Bacteroidota bacterium]